MPKPNSGKPQEKVTITLSTRPELRPVLARLQDKTGMRSLVDIVALALKQLDANLPPAQVDQPMENRVAH